jgi:hypothetical protein
MQQGSVIREHRKLGPPDVWCFRCWEAGPNGNRAHRESSWELPSKCVT